MRALTHCNATQLPAQARAPDERPPSSPIFGLLPRVRVEAISDCLQSLHVPPNPRRLVPG